MMKRYLQLCLILGFASCYAHALEQAKDLVEAAQENHAYASIQTFDIAEDFNASVYADETQVAYPVAINFDLRNQLYVSQSLKHINRAIGVARYPKWALDDYKITSFQDRINLHHKHNAMKSIASLTEYSEEIQQLIDTNSDGRVDVSRTFATGFNDLLDGVAAGIAISGEEVYFTCVPHLWKLKDSDQDGKCDQKISLVKGFGVRIGVHGHDLHAPIFGPDGKLYFSLGDRGFDITTLEGKHLYNPNGGAVFRCNSDGSNLEIFHYGLRNPQGLAFDAHGNLFTVDNDMGAGDRSRVIYVIEGADSGWRANYQIFRNFKKEVDRVGHEIVPPWISEKLWGLHDEFTPTYLHSPSAHLTHGPSGMAYDPGYSWPSRLKDHFYVCDYQSPSNSGVLAFKMKSDGAGFSLDRSEMILKNCMATDVTFSYQGDLYVSDWIEGNKNKPTANAIYKLSPKDKPVRVDFVPSNFSKLDTSDLKNYLSHSDLRVRLYSQFELAKRATAGYQVLLDQALNGTNLYSRLHGIWGVGQMGQKDPHLLKPLVVLLKDPELEVRAQTSKVMGEGKYQQAIPYLITLLNDPSPRVQYFSVLSLSKLNPKESVPSIVMYLQNSSENDPIIRHACSLALAKALDSETIKTYRDHSSLKVRMVLLLAMIKRKDIGLAYFLNDPDQRMVKETVRALYDSIATQASYNLLAQKLSDPEFLENIEEEMLIYRVINANLMQGDAQALRRMVDFIEKNPSSEKAKLEALAVLSEWKTPHDFDRVLWHYRPLINRTFGEIENEIYRLSKKMIEGGQLSDDHMKLANQLYEKTMPLDDMNLMLNLINSISYSSQVRIKALDSWIESKPAAALAQLERLMDDPDLVLKKHTLTLMTVLHPESAVPLLKNWLSKENIEEQRLALQLLANIESPETISVYQSLFNNYQANLLNKKLHFDFFSSFNKHKNSDIKKLSSAYELREVNYYNMPSEVFYEGGNSKNGEQIFHNSSAQCLSCHKVKGLGGDAGPDLSVIGKSRDPSYLFNAMMNPNADIAPAFGTMVVNLKDDSSLAGILLKEDDRSLSLRTFDKKEVTIEKETIKTMIPPVSIMPPMENILQAEEVRDLVAYLKSLK